ncbi:chitin synthase-like isoform X2 [Mercenaria mercenaria]|uniref:chitin synthase-like isoform X2 n=1 Tax=Mercenaria mercenaria TaxID=6596 RepID=UPI00234EA1B4|nr:chitin synthase-like isoform X2 [Mercenaria mercenaria]
MENTSLNGIKFLKKKGATSPSVSSGYNSVSSVPSLNEADEIQSSLEDKNNFSEDLSASTSKLVRKPSIVLMSENGAVDELEGESHDFDATSEAEINSSGKIPAFDAFGETKRKGAKSYNIEKRFLQICRFLMYLVMFSVILGGGVLTKLSVLSLASKYRQSKGESRTRYAVYFVTLVCLYPCFTLLSSLFKVLFGRLKSPSKGFIALLMVIEVLHTVGLLLFLFKVLSHLAGISAVYVMMCAPVLPSLMSLFSILACSTGNHKKRVLKLIFYMTIFIFQVGGFVLSYFLGVLNDLVANEVIWIAPLSIVLISIKWWENFVEFKSSKFSKFGILKTFESDIQKPRDKANVLTVSCKLLTVGLIIMLVVYEPHPFFNVDSHDFPRNSTSKSMQNASFHTIESQLNTGDSRTPDCNINGQNGSLPNSSCIETPATSKANSVNADSSKNWFLQLFEDIRNFIYEHSLVLQIIALTFVVSYCAALACKLHMQRIGFSLATLLVSPLTLTYILLKCGDKLTFDVITLELTYICPSWELTSGTHIGLAAGLWISMCLLTIYVWFPNSERMAKLERMFLPELKDCIFVDYNLLLRRRKDAKKLHREEGMSGKVVPKVYICATMWHENWKEMVQLLKSLLRIDRHCAVSRTAERNFGVAIEDPDKFEPEIHIIFDDAFDVDDDSKQFVPNKYVFQFMACLDEAATDILGSETKNEWDSSPLKSNLPYGGRLTWTLPGKTKMVVHLKNKLKIRHRKRWSQVMYLYYLLGFETFQYKSRDEVLRERKVKIDIDHTPRSFRNVLPDKDKIKLENTFILTLDGDVDFKPKSVLLLIDRMKKNAKVGAVCGRIHPIGSGPLVWYQKFEYAVGHWLQKAAEHVLGCVLCCPGCFSLFRASALIDDNVVKTYTKKPTKALHYIQFEQGEDRWLCTLLLQQGYKVDYCAGADAYTFAPETFNEFFIQRRRWSPSTNANIFDLLKSWNHTTRQNANISRLFMAYQALMLATSLLAPATVTLMITGSYSSVLGFDSWTSYVLSIAPIIFFIIVCMKCKQETQLFFAALLSSVYTIVMIIVTIGTILNIATEQILSPNVLFLIGLAIIFSASALWHPKEFGCLLHGLLYYVAVPSTFIFLTIYYICNLNVVTWGTREDKQTKVQTNIAEKKKIRKIESVLNFMSKKILKNKKLKKTMEVYEEELEKVNVESSNSEEDKKENSPEDSTYWMRLSSFEKYKTEEDSRKEEQFWKRLLRKYLLPIEGNRQHEEKIKSDLLSLRNNVVFAFFMINFMFSIALLQLQINREQLIDFYFFGKYEPVSVIFLAIFSVLLVLQFISMIIHRWGTFQHLISSTRILSCRQLSAKEKFEIHFREAKEHIDHPNTHFDSDTEIDQSEDNCNMYSDENGEDERQREKKIANLYERKFSKNFARTLKLKSNRRHRLQSVDWNTRRFSVSRNPRKEYVNRLYQNPDLY